MNKLTTGLIAGGILGAVGLTVAMGDKKMRKTVSQDSKKMMNKANRVLNKMDLM